jgi:hypothetical protein
MAIDPKTRIPIRNELMFAHGAYATTAVVPVLEFKDGKSTGRQKVDEETGKPVFSVTVLDADPSVTGPAKSVKVNIVADVQPVPPAPQDGFPFPLVEFEGLAVKPYAAMVMEGRYKVAYSVYARGFANTGKPATTR